MAPLSRVRTLVAGTGVGTLTSAALFPSLPTRLLEPITSTIAAFAGPSTVGFIVYQSVVGNQDLGLALAWVLVGYLTYAHTEMLYPDDATVADSPGFRILTALFTVVFGLGVWGTLVPGAVPSVLHRRVYEPIGAVGDATVVFSSTILLLCVSLLAGTVMFWYYLMHTHDRDLYDPDTGILDPFGGFFYDEDDRPNERWNLSENRWGRYLRGSDVVAVAMFPVLVACIVGTLGVILNRFYPLPEVALFIGLLANKLGFFSDSRTSRLGPSVYEVDVRIVDSVSAASENLKGSILVLYGILGFLLSGTAFFVGVGAILLVLRSVTRSVRLASGVDGSTVVFLLGLGSLLLAMCLMGIYSLIYWLRRLERAGAAAEYWDATWSRDDYRRPHTNVACPGGLLVPAHLPFVAIAVLGGVLPSIESILVAGIVFLGAGILASSPMIWSLRRFRLKDRSQREWSVRTDPRDTLLTLLIQTGTIWGLFAVDWSTLTFDSSSLLTVCLGGVLLTALYYIPDGTRWASSRVGLWKFVGDVPTVMLATCIMALVVVQWDLSPLLGGIIGAVALFSISMTVLEVYFDSKY